MNSKLSLIEELTALLKAPKNLKKSIEDLLTQNTKLAKEIEKLNAEKAGNLKGDLQKEIKEVNGVNFLAKKVDLDANGIKTIAFQLKAEMDNLFLILCNENNGKANITILISDNLAKEKDLNAGKIVRELAKEINGGGGLLAWSPGRCRPLRPVSGTWPYRFDSSGRGWWRSSRNCSARSGGSCPGGGRH